MFKFIKNLITKIKDGIKQHKAEHDLFIKDYYFYREESNLEIYDHTPITIFLNGHRIYADNPRGILIEDECIHCFLGYDYTQVSMLKMLIFFALLDTTGQGIEFTINGDQWKAISSRYYFRDLLKTG